MSVDVRQLFHHDAPHTHKAEVKKDKLAETKKQEALLKEVLKAERDKHKDEKAEEAHAMSEVYRMERAYNHTSKRAAKDDRKQAKHDAKHEAGEMCEHGIWKCRICFPHKTDK